MGQYREVHFDSRGDGRLSGNRSHPRFIFNDPIYLDKFCLKNVQLPLTWLNIEQDEIITFWFNGAATEWPILIPADNYDATGLAALLQQELLVANNTISGVANPWGAVTVVAAPTTNQVNIFLTFSNMVANPNTWRLQFTANGTAFGTDSPQTARFMGFPTSQTVWEADLVAPTGLAKTTPYPTKAADVNYLLLRSSMANGAQYSANTTSRAGSWGSSNILAKIPVDLTFSGYGKVQNYFTNDPPVLETMFNYTGGEVSALDLYFTRPNSDTVLDLNGYSFQVTLGLYTSTPV